LAGLQPGQIGLDDQRRFGLAQKDVRGGAERFQLRNARDLLKAAADPADHQRHHADVIEHRNQCREEDDHRQAGDGEALAAHIGRGQRAEQQLDPRMGITQQIRDAARHHLQGRIALGDIEHQRRDTRLKRKSRTHHARANGTTVARQGKGNAQNQRDSGQAQNNMHQFPFGVRASTRPAGTSLSP
jgi:hypothetical protein